MVSGSHCERETPNTSFKKNTAVKHSVHTSTAKRFNVVLVAERMEELAKLQRLSLLGKVSKELENHLGVNDRDLSEFVVHLAEISRDLESFRIKLEENAGKDAFSEALSMKILCRTKTGLKLP